MPAGSGARAQVLRRPRQRSPQVATQLVTPRPGAVLKVLRQDKVRARAKGRYFTSGSFGHKELGFDSDVEVDLSH